jgi:hypothetical protein
VHIVLFIFSAFTILLLFSVLYDNPAASLSLLPGNFKFLTENGMEENVIQSTRNLCDFHSVKKFDSKGNFITSWGTKGTGDSQFLHPHGITVDSSGQRYYWPLGYWLDCCLRDKYIDVNF